MSDVGRSWPDGGGRKSRGSVIFKGEDTGFPGEKECKKGSRGVCWQRKGKLSHRLGKKGMFEFLAMSSRPSPRKKERAYSY